MQENLHGPADAAAACCRPPLHANFAPPASPALPQEAAGARLDALLASGQDIDADAIVRWSLASFLAYLFGEEEWRPEYEVLVQASWEWRKVRGRGDSNLHPVRAAGRCGFAGRTSASGRAGLMSTPSPR